MFVAAALAGVGVLLVGLLLWLLVSSSHGRVCSMLLLSRRPKSLKSDIILNTLDGPIIISVQQVRGQTVQIGIDAPQSVLIDRPDRSVKNEPVPA
jgi:sRNA-binding carbon storage regulator CsrA